MFKKILKMTGLLILSIILLIILITIVFVYTSPQFGGSPTKAQKLAYAQTGHYEDGKFVNQVPSPMDVGIKDIPSLLYQQIKGDPNKQPGIKFDVQKIDSLEIERKPDSITRLTWFGHSTFLLEIAGKKILIDPMFGDVPAPHPWLGRSRYSNGLPIEIEKLPQIDAIIMSHDHYDHLDYGSIIRLKEKTKEFYMPLGVGAHFRKWGVPDERIHELDWWDDIELDSLKFTCTPARHFSGRGFSDRAATLWASWVIESPGEKIYFSGDSGYGPHFKEIGERFGGFDFAMMECGQYNEKWHSIHMMPEETIQAAVDIRSKMTMPIHWAAFTLSLHSWTDPVERALKKADELNVPFCTPQIGEPVIVGKSYPDRKWWRALN
jgi:L-ascorbate metabolism protein UlaG (beta-lactamase superfamily)/ABC-type cobalt transport system substrate-binding protein